MDLNGYDKILINSSAGKDSLAMLHYIAMLADTQNVDRSKLVVVHADLGRAEWKGTRELAEEQANLYGLEFRAVSRDQDLLDQISARGMWPSNKARYCTSDHKRDQISKIFTAIAKDENLCRPIKILNCMGIRAQESAARAKKVELESNARATGKGQRKIVDNWLPILDWSEDKVWSLIKDNDLPYHHAYDLGMPRLSCVFCVFAPKAALMIAGKANPDLLDTYIEMEKEMGHDFRQGFKIAEVKEAIQADEKVEAVASWNM